MACEKGEDSPLQGYECSSYHKALAQKLSEKKGERYQDIIRYLRKIVIPCYVYEEVHGKKSRRNNPRYTTPQNNSIQHILHSQFPSRLELKCNKFKKFQIPRIRMNCENFVFYYLIVDIGICVYRVTT